MVRTAWFRGLVVALLAPLWTPGGSGAIALAADQWTNLTGTSTVSGEMIGLWNGRVLLQLDGGRRVSVRMEDLRADSRIQAEKRLAEIQQRLQQRRAEIAQAAQEAEAPAPTNAAELPPAPSYSVPPPGADLRTTLVAVRDQTFSGHLRIFYDTLPASYQQQTDELVALALAKLNTASFESARTAIHGLAELIVTRQRWLLSHPRLAQLPDDQQQRLIATAELMRALTGDDVMSLASLRSRPFGESVARLDETLAPQLYRLLSDSSVETSAPFDFEVEAGSNGVMVAKVIVPFLGPMGSAEFKSVEGRWVLSGAPKAAGAARPGAFSSGPLSEGAYSEESFSEGAAPAAAPAADDGWKTARAFLEPLPDESLRLPPEAEAMLQQLAAAIAPLQQAGTQHEFHRALDELLPQIAILVNQVSGYQPPRTAGPAGAYDSSNPYGSENESSFDPTLSGSAESMP